MANNKIPDNYFSNKAEQILDAIRQLEDNVADNAPLLHAYSKNEGYLIPDNYFESFQAKILKNNNVGKSRSIRLYRIAVAATVLALISIAWFSNSWNLATEDELQMTEVYDYYIDNVQMIDQQMIIDLGAEYADIIDLESVYISEDDLDIMEETILDEMTDQEFLDLL